MGFLNSIPVKSETSNLTPVRPRSRHRSLIVAASVASVGMFPSRADASLFHGETLDTVADVLSWVVLIVAPAIGIAVFWLVHILPEKIAEKKKHPQAKAIQVMCLLSLVFGGMLWPIAWLWAYSKPVLHKLAYGTDVDESHGREARASHTTEVKAVEQDQEQLRARIAELESKLSAFASAAKKGKA